MISPSSVPSRTTARKFFSTKGLTHAKWRWNNPAVRLTSTGVIVPTPAIDIASGSCYSP